MSHDAIDPTCVVPQVRPKAARAAGQAEAVPAAPGRLSRG
ncbi:hypothetical protein DFW101_3313 [Solidesulfovibrio carbinoliphilus subsp. oakridgensis]|uniref:Uncharacterized protein n=1 Tax=Solidesulfovibrio carbinoliphilus subsp. oakridgensis TaxID=694327 RepID=G7QAT1_9BACT|nr:hypothetical protein DFW101_3313 [Solidesulfovibrio carbinoliphilus subsp. oakridgensis]